MQCKTINFGNVHGNRLNFFCTDKVITAYVGAFTKLFFSFQLLRLSAEQDQEVKFTLLLHAHNAYEIFILFSEDVMLSL